MFKLALSLVITGCALVRSVLAVEPYKPMEKNRTIIHIEKMQPHPEKKKWSNGELFPLRLVEISNLKVENGLADRPNKEDCREWKYKEKNNDWAIRGAFITKERNLVIVQHEWGTMGYILWERLSTKDKQYVTNAIKDQKWMEEQLKKLNEEPKEK